MSRTGCRSLALTALIAITAFTGCASSSSPEPAPSPVPVVHRIDVPPDLTAEPAVAVPATVSADGRVVVGTVFVYRDQEFVPTAAFRWTLDGGTTILEAPGRLTTVATAVSEDGAIVAGFSYDLSVEDATAWVWSTSTGFRWLPAPAQATSFLAHDLTADGRMVLGTALREDAEGNQWADVFVWSEEFGSVALNRGLLAGQALPVGISDDGLRIAYQCTDLEPDGCDQQGVFTIQSASRDWDPTSYIVAYPPVAQSENRFSASTLLTTPFGVFSAHASDLGVIGGRADRDVHGVRNLGHPSIWIAALGQLDILTGLGENGDTTAVSPDGSLAAYDSHLAVGTGYVTVWSAASGSSDLQRLIERADANLGSHLLDTYPAAFGLVGHLMGFSADGTRAAGVLVDLSRPDPDLMFGWVLDRFDLLLP